MRHILYRITCKISGKKYIGYTSQSIEKRWQQHICDSKVRPEYIFHRAINKYGSENFLVEKVAEYETREEALAHEIICIANENTLKPNGYNICPGGQYGGFCYLSHENRRKIAEKASRTRVSRMSESDKKEKARQLRAGRIAAELQNPNKMKEAARKAIQTKRNLGMVNQRAELVKQKKKLATQPPSGLCEYGCGQVAKFRMKMGKNCCSSFYTKCPIISKKNKDANTKRRSLELS